MQNEWHCLLNYIAIDTDRNTSERIPIKSLNCEEDATILSLLQPNGINLNWGPTMYWDFLNIVSLIPKNYSIRQILLS